MKMKFSIPCIHETKGIPTLETVADYHPLTLEEIITLINLAHAYKKESPTVVDDIQKRLVQGIMGMTCPRPKEGEISKNMSVVKILFSYTMKNDVHPTASLLLALQLFKLMTLETDADVVGPIFSKADILTKGIEELELSYRAHNCLKKLNINTIGELTNKTETELLKERNVGRKILSEVKDALIERDLYFAERN